MNSKRRFRVPKSRSTPKKPKFLSLSRQFPPGEVNKAGSLTPMRPSSAASVSNKAEPPQIDLVEIHEHDENVAYFFSAADGGAASLTGLLDGAAESNSSHATDVSSSSLFPIRQDDFSPSASLTYANRIQDGEDTAALVRNALRSRERESSEEKWVCYSEVVERKVIKEEEVSSSVADLWWRPSAGEDPAPLSLKLDYDDVVKAWSGRGPLYVETTQIVPDIADGTFLSNNGVKAEVNMGWWTVPEMDEQDDDNETLGEMMRLKLGQREASLLRYKAKRQNRLFSKKIRYQVRKLNAEKRPRIKGRFVKRG